MKFKKILLLGFLPLGLLPAHEENLINYELDDVIVSSSPLGLGTNEITQSTTILESDLLNDLRSDTIASSISQQPGINQTYYGPNANRPVIRGMGGYRVNVLENGLSSFDLSASSNDHSVTINPLLIDRIEILRGSSTLIHGSNSIGGIINVFDSSIPNLSSGASLKNEFRIRSCSVDNGRYSSGILFHQSGDFIFQVNGSSAKTQAYETPAFELHGHEHEHVITYAQLTPPSTLITTPVTLGEEDEEEVDEVEDIRTKVLNTQSDTNTYGFGASYNHDNGFIGVSYSDYTSSYGVPNHESSIISIDREKYSLQSLYKFDSGYFDSANFQLTYGDYVHSEEAGHDDGDDDSTLTYYEYHEVEGEFDPVTPEEHDHHALFMYEGIDSKLILSKDESSQTTALSLSLTDYDMKITGEESYLAAMNHYNENIAESENERITNDATRRLGLGLMHKKKLSDSFSVNGGIRYETTTRKYDAFKRSDHDHGATPISANFQRDDSTMNASIGFVSKQSDTITFSGNLHYSERLPETSELYSSGAHHATESFEMGNPNLTNEESIGVEFSLSNNQGDFNQKLTVFYNDYENFIFQSDTGEETSTEFYRLLDPILGDDEEVENIPNTLDENADIYVLADSEEVDEFEAMSIRQYKGVEAKLYGLEYEFDYKLDSTRYITGFADSITAKNETDNISLPRIPPYRIGLSYHQDFGDYKFSLNAVHNGEQDDLGSGEEVTDNYTVLNARLGYTINDSELYLRVNNLTDTLGFVHTSFLKESAPIAGRSFEIGYNLTF